MKLSEKTELTIVYLIIWGSVAGVIVGIILAYRKIRTDGGWLQDLVVGLLTLFYVLLIHFGARYTDPTKRE